MQLILKLDANARRPVVKLDWFNGCRALIDTGALFPVWTASEKILTHKLGAKLEKVTYLLVVLGVTYQEHYIE